MSTKPPFAILKPVLAPPRLNVCTILQEVRDPEVELSFLINGRVNSQDPMALDFETRGDVTGDGMPVGVALSDQRGNWYIDFLSSHPSTYHYIIAALATHRVPLVAHNLFFDASWTQRDFPLLKPNWVHCTYALYKLLATEGYAGQRHGLKEAMVDVLGWEESNEAGIDKWLCENGYGQIKNMKVGDRAGTIVYQPDKSEMWRVPADILGQYACLDADATYQMYTKVLLPALEKFKAFQEYIGPMYMQYIELLIAQKLSGMQINRDKLSLYRDKLTSGMSQLQDEFLSQSEVSKFIQQYNNVILDSERKKQPAQFKKDGTISKNYLKWEERYRLASEKNHFNLASGPQRQWLFYECLGKELSRRTDSREPSALIKYQNKEFEVLLTDSGQLPTDEKALKQFGHVAKPLLKYIENQKELGYVEAVLSHSITGILHPGFKVPGTSTGRLAGAGGVNIQQMPGSKEFLEAFEARAGKVWVGCDHCYSEDTEVLTSVGWKHFDEIDYQSEVWQVNPTTMIGSWTNPLDIVWKRAVGPMYEIGNRRGSLIVSENHKMLYKGQDGRSTTNIQLAKQDIKKGWALPINSNSSWESSISSKDIWISCMLQADGYLWKEDTYTIEVSKKRKRDKVNELLGYKGHVNSRDDGIRMESERWSNIRYTSDIMQDKRFSLMGILGSNQVEEFLEALAFWDGHIDAHGAVQWTTTSHHNANEVQQYFVTAGYEAKLSSRFYEDNKRWSTLYILRIKKRASIRLRPQDRRQVEYDGMIGCVTVPEGFIMVRRNGQTFVSGNTSLEQVVLAELSQDASLWKLFGPTAKPNDIYLFSGASMPGLGEKIRATGYDPDNPTPDAIARAKKECKTERQLSKVVVLGSSYGMGPGKLQRTLAQQGIIVSFSEAQAIHAAYWKLYAGVKKYEAYLLRQWQDNNGWVLNGIGRPICVADGYEKDIVNRVVQSTGHDLHIMYILIVTRLLKEAGIPWGGIIIDLHDAMTIEIEPQHADIVKEIMQRRAYQELHSQCGGKIALKGEAKIINNWAEDKE